MIRPVRSDGRIETGGAFRPIVRSRVIERIADAAGERIALIVAPAGYGKSVALSQFLATYQEPWLRFDLKPDHDALAAVIRSFAEAIEEAAPEARRSFASAYERNRASETAGADLALWMNQHLKGWRGTIVVDDLHAAEKDPEVVRFFVGLIERTKKHVRWILSTRGAAGLPIGSWLAYGDCDLMVDEYDLSFTLEETKEVASAFKLRVQESELRTLLDITQGWPTALSFALRSSTRSVDFFKLTSLTREMVYQYLAEQVYAALSQEEREFLEAASLLSEIDVEVMVTVGFDRARKLIGELRDRVAFLYEVRPGVFRCHDLFRDFVLHELELEGDAATNRLRCTIAQAMERLERPSAALRLYAQAAAQADVLRLVEEHGFDLLATGHADLVLVAIAALAEEHRKEHPVALALRGVLEISGGRFSEAEPLLKHSIERTSDAGLRASVSMRLALLYINQGVDASNVLDPLVGEPSIPPELIAEALALRAVVAARAGDLQRAGELLEKVEAGVHGLEESDSLARTLQRVGVAAWELRQDQRARFALARCAEMSNRLSLHGLACLALDTLALEARHCENDVPYALWYAQQAAAAAAKSGDIFSMQNTTLRLLSLEMWRGNVERMIALEHQAGDLRTSDPSRGIYLVSSHAYRYAWEGKFVQAHTALATILNRIPNGFDRIMTRAVYALCLSLDAKTKESKDEISVLVTAIDEEKPQLDGFASLAMEIAQLLGVLSEIVAGRRTVAGNFLRRRPVLCSRPGAEAMREAVTRLLRHTPGPVDLSDELAMMEQYALGGFGRLVQRAGESLAQDDDSGLLESERHLTAAEAAVLRLLADGLTPKEIAAQTERSVLTVQTHIKHITAKLNCRGTVDVLKLVHRRGLEALIS
ncbi:MAG: LuxR C-terminal-related transcriptional regulator [Candidatus Tyrphobacter sp.]